jgi:uncharacterized protein YacL
MIRFIFIILAALAAFILAPSGWSVILRASAAGVMFVALFLFFLFASRLRPSSAKSVLSGSLGVLAGLAAGRLLAPLVGDASSLVQLFLGFVGYVLGYDHGALLSGFRSGDAASGTAADGAAPESANFVKNKILDTSTIIDGRILDVSKTGYLEGIYLIPRFVLQELQLLSDSSDSQKRIRGRRGMDLVNKMQKSRDILVQIIDRDFTDTRQVDNKLINLAKEIGGAIVTTDFNLMKTAQIQGVKTFNINQLAEALKPVVLPGQMMDILIVKPGKDPNQGIGYLEDGTMIVVENASRSVNKKRKVEVTSVIQTETGRMIFGK